MSLENPTSTPPEEIIVEEVPLQTNVEGKKYETEENGVFYGGDYLPKPPTEINLDLEIPPAPEADGTVL